LLLDPTGHIGDAPERTLALAARIKKLPPFPPRAHTRAEAMR
jgi:hypothetical protein